MAGAYTGGGEERGGSIATTSYHSSPRFPVVAMSAPAPPPDTIDAILQYRLGDAPIVAAGGEGEVPGPRQRTQELLQAIVLGCKVSAPFRSRTLYMISYI